MPVSKTPTIKLLFTGLQAFFFNSEGTSCRVGMHNQAPSHQLCFQVSVMYGKSECLIDLSKAANGYDIHLNVVNPKKEGVEIYKKGKFNRESLKHDPKDFRWAIGIRSEEFHGAVPIIDKVLRPSFYTNNGLFHTESTIKALLVRKKGNVNKLVQIAEYIGANIDLQNSDGEAILTFGKNGSQSLHLRKEPNTRYRITIFNNCSGTESFSNDSDFKLYYKAFSVAADDQFDLKGFSERVMLSPDSPCVPVCGQDGFC